jgi:transcriptional regulator with XRE-family HTH domain
MSDEEFLRLVHAAIGFKKLDGFQYKTLARELGVSKQLLSQYLQGDIAMPEQIRDKIIEILDLGCTRRNLIKGDPHTAQISKAQTRKI